MRSACSITAALLAASLVLRAAETNGAPRRIVVLGDSLSAGYGLTPAEAWPQRLQELVASNQLPYTVVNAGVSGDTTAGGLRRVDWVLRQPVDILVLELGGNDGLRGIQPSTTRSNLVGIIRKTREKWPHAAIVLTGMQMPTSMGRDYTEAFATVFPEVAHAEKALLVPHLLETVGGVPEFNLPDLVHPNPTGHRLVASNVWNVLGPFLHTNAPPARN